MTTNWALPKTIDQYAESGAEALDVSWQEVDNFNALKYVNGKYIKTERDIVHIARDPKHDIKEKTYFLRLRNFNFENIPGTISGLEVKVSMNRYGRIFDDTIQLSLNNDLIGNNFAGTDLLPVTIYGNNSEKWNTTLTKTDLQDPTFGVVLRYKSHPNWPHKNSALVDSVQIRVH